MWEIVMEFSFTIACRLEVYISAVFRVNMGKAASL